MKLTRAEILRQAAMDAAFARITRDLFTQRWLRGASLLLELNDTDGSAWGYQR